MHEGFRIIKNTGYLYAKMGITMFISLYTTRLILNSLGASDFGIFNIVGGAIAMLGFLNASMASATQRFMSYYEGAKDKDKQKNIFNVSIVLHFCIAVSVAVLLLAAGYFFFNGILNIPDGRIDAAKIVYGSLIISTAFTVMTVPYEAVMNAHENMKYYAIVGIFESLLKLAVAFACVYTSYDKLIVYGMLMACIPLVTMTIMRVYCHKKYEECVIKPRIYYKKAVFREMVGFAGWNLFATGASVITNNGVSIVINMFFGTVVNAAQGIANQINGQLMALTVVMSKAISPVITKSEGSRNHEKTLQMAETSSKLLFFVTSLLAFPAILMMPDILQIWLKNVPEFATFFASVQLMIFLCEQLTGGYGTAINATGKIKGISVMKSIFKFAYLPLSYVLFRSGFSVIASYSFLFVIQGLTNGLVIPVCYVDKVLGYSKRKYFISIFLPVVISSFIVLVTGRATAFLCNGVIAIVVTTLVCTVINVVCFYFIVLSKRETALVKELFKTLSLRLFHHRC